MNSKDLDVKMKIRRIINTPGISDRTIIGNISEESGIGKYITGINEKLETKEKKDGKIVQLTNPRSSEINSLVTIFDADHYPEDHTDDDPFFLDGYF